MSLLSLLNDLLISQLINLPFLSLISLCTSNQRLLRLFDNDYLWEQKFKLDLSIYLSLKVQNETWKSFYFRIIKYNWIHTININNGNTQSKILIDPRFTLREETNYILETLNLAFKNQYFMF